ncbi:MAG: hypothetical protein ACO3EE_09960 [Flavobacteriales bacterium]|jgi:hypothetical protein
MKNKIKTGLFATIVAISVTSCGLFGGDDVVTPAESNNSEVRTAEVDTNKARTETPVAPETKTEEGAKTE